jgi:hypothetical protein
MLSKVSPSKMGLMFCQIISPVRSDRTVRIESMLEIPIHARSTKDPGDPRAGPKIFRIIFHHNFHTLYSRSPPCRTTALDGPSDQPAYPTNGSDPGMQPVNFQRLFYIYKRFSQIISTIDNRIYR